eukprot:TRINITY_DN2935_c2_g2_i2.p2 TRINITY_DN2935_c2_g2~~TRINITY_DN2935_c2_g2_i2.p2  ORF type:complete len:339 (+),score=72.12 TRINITY_DN2935_c2_g2_i2:80-1018(+)
MSTPGPAGPAATDEPERRATPPSSGAASPRHGPQPGGRGGHAQAVLGAVCCTCGLRKAKACFSKTQWCFPLEKRKCRECAEQERDSRGPRPGVDVIPGAPPAAPRSGAAQLERGRASPRPAPFQPVQPQQQPQQRHLLPQQQPQRRRSPPPTTRMPPFGGGGLQHGQPLGPAAAPGLPVHDPALWHSLQMAGAGAAGAQPAGALGQGPWHSPSFIAGYLLGRASAGAAPQGAPYSCFPPQGAGPPHGGGGPPGAGGAMPPLDWGPELPAAGPLGSYGGPSGAVPPWMVSALQGLGAPGADGGAAPPDPSASG